MDVRNSRVSERIAIRGITLIELMVVVAIIGVIAAFAYPAYTDYIARGKIQTVTAALSEIRVKLEQYFQDNRTYVGACVATTVAPLPTGDVTKYFDVACTLTATSFTVTASGWPAGTPGRDTSMAGFTYTIDQSNARQTTSLPAGWGSTPVNCWVTRKGGQC